MIDFEVTNSAVYDQAKPEKGSKLPTAKFIFNGDNPVGFTSPGLPYREIIAGIKVTEGNKWSRWNRLKERFSDPDCASFLHSLNEALGIHLDLSIWETTYTELQIETADRPGADLDQEGQDVVSDQYAGAVKDEKTYKMAWDQIYKWLKKIRKQGFQAREHKVDLPEENISFRRIILGNIKPESNKDKQAEWAVDAKISETLMFAKHRLSITIPDSITVFSVATIEEENHDWLYLMSNLQTVLECGGMCFREDGSVLVLSIGANFEKTEAGSPVKEEQTKIYQRTIYTKKEADIACHEIAHLIDPNLDHATFPQKEAFAVCNEYGFDFKKIKDYLRSDCSYGRKITSDQIKQLLSRNHHEGLPSSEQYYLSASLFSFVFEKFGAEKFMQFYGLLAGSNDAVWSDGARVYLIEDHLNMRRDKSSYRCNGDVSSSLDVICKTEPITIEASSDELLSEYIEKINEGI